MASPKLLTGRLSQAGTSYVVTTLVDQRRPLFCDPLLAGIVVKEIERCTSDANVTSQAWVVMPDHVHWLFQLRCDPLSRCLQAFKSRSARAINAEVMTHGRVWQPGFYDHRLRHDDDLATQARYLVTNPLRSGLVQRIEDYPFWWCRWIERSADL